MLGAKYGASRRRYTGRDDVPGFAYFVLVMLGLHSCCGQSLGPHKMRTGGCLAATAIASPPAVLVAAEMALSTQALVPLGKVILLEGLQVRALLGEH